MAGIDTLALYTIGMRPICFSSVKSAGAVRINCAVTMLAEPAVTYTINTGDPSNLDVTSFSYSTPEIGKYSMVTWDAFLEDVFPSVQGCPKSMVLHAIKAACIDFCEKTLIWKQDSINNDIIAGEASYTFAPPSGAKVVTPYRIEVISPEDKINVELEAFSLETLESFDPNWRTKEQRIPYAYVLITDDTVRLIGIPTEDLPESLIAHVAIKPTRDANECPDFLREDWADVIAAGALARLHAHAGKVWAQPSLVAHYTKLYRDGISRARSKASKSWLRESKNILPVGFTNTKGYH